MECRGLFHGVPAFVLTVLRFCLRPSFEEVLPQEDVPQEEMQQEVNVMSSHLVLGPLQPICQYLFL